MLKKSTPKKASAPTKTPAPKKAAPKKTVPKKAAPKKAAPKKAVLKKPPPKKASAPNKEITSDIEASASHLPAVSKRHLQPKRMSKPILKISILKNIKRLLRTLHGTHVLFQCILLCFDTFPLNRNIPLLDRDVLSLNNRDIPLLDRDVLSLNDRDIPLLDCDVLTFGISDHDVRVLALGHDALRNALLCLIATKGLYSILNTKLRHMWPNDRNC